MVAGVGVVAAVSRHCGAAAAAGAGAGADSGAWATLGTKSRWRTRAKEPIEPMKAITAPMIMRWSRVAENPTR